MELAALAHPIVIRISPQAEAHPYSVTGVNPSIAVLVALGQSHETVFGDRPAGEGRRVSKELASCSDLPVTISIQDEEGVILASSCPTHHQRRSIRIEVEQDRLGETGQMKAVSDDIEENRRGQAVLIVVVHQPIPVIIDSVVAVSIGTSLWTRWTVRTC